MSRLTQTDWMVAGFRSLTENGPQTLKAEPLARSLGTTKGSFYWHFKDVPTFQASMLEHWEEKATREIIVLLDSIPSPEAKLRTLAKVSTELPDGYGGVGVEPAIRAWAKSDERVEQAVRRVDGARLAHLSGIFEQLGMANPDLPKLFYAGLIGLQEVAHGNEDNYGAPLGTLADLMIALSETD
ncbi:TetR/AcrR family transcriptional regulator [Planktotalea sp.]|uniref:TetR/AcrR family transcriptional regulator n=1 Tax=Planktotalea sp. TaxID=2029877 RepID=UPI00329935CC